MADLGGVAFLDDSSGNDSAAAFILAAPPDRKFVVPVGSDQVEVRPEVAYAVARFSGAPDAESAHQMGLAVVQEGLDLLSISGKADLRVERVFEEYLVLWSGEVGRIVRIHSTTTLKFSVSGVVTLRDADGREISPSPATPSPHPAFRYFRLSQTSTDVHEAFRNMYLCFELLLSSAFPMKQRERERAWLERGLSLAGSDLGLQGILRGTGADPVGQFIDQVYTAIRLPLFHAKAGRNVIPPHGPQGSREQVGAALDLLTKVVLRMAEVWHGARRGGGGVFHARVYQTLRDIYSTATVLALPTADPLDQSQSDLSAPKYEKAVAFHTEVRDHPSDKRIPVLFGEVEVASLWTGGLVRLEVVGEDRPMLAHTLEEPLRLSGFDRLQYVDASAIINMGQPRLRFPQ